MAASSREGAGRAKPTAVSVVAVTALGGLVLTVAIQAARPNLGFMEFDDLREGQLEAAAAMVLTVAAGVLFGRLHREPLLSNLLLPTALLVVAAANLYATIATPIVDSLAARRFATWTVAGATLYGALLLAVATMLPPRRLRAGWRMRVAVITAGGAGVALVATGSALLGERLPRAFETLPRTLEDIQLLSQHPALIAVELVTAAAFALAAFRLARRAGRGAVGLTRWLGVAAVVSAIAFVNYALFPSRFTELLHVGDLFVLIATGILLYGTIVEITSTEASLVREVSSERQRVASELRSGVAQELAFMASQAHVLSSQSAERSSFEKLAASVERALDESRGAIAALDRPVDEPVAAAIRHAALEVADRVGVTIEVDLDHDVNVTREQRDGLVRLTREAVAVAVRQRDAQRVSVALRHGHPFTLRIDDDGVAIDARSSTHDVSLRALRERADALGATLTYTEGVGASNTLEVVMPR